MAKVQIGPNHKSRTTLKNGDVVVISCGADGWAEVPQEVAESYGAGGWNVQLTAIVAGALDAAKKKVDAFADALRETIKQHKAATTDKQKLKIQSAFKATADKLGVDLETIHDDLTTEETAEMQEYSATALRDLSSDYELLLIADGGAKPAKPAKPEATEGAATPTVEGAAGGEAAPAADQSSDETPAAK